MKSGTFLVTESDSSSAVVRDVADGQIHALSANPGFDRGDVVEATLAPDPPLELTWTVEAVDARRSVAVEASEERPPDRAFEAAPDESGAAVTIDDGGATVDVLAVTVGETDAAVEDVLTDDATLTRAARLGASRVTVRGADGVIAVRYA